MDWIGDRSVWVADGGTGWTGYQWVETACFEKFEWWPLSQACKGFQFYAQTSIQFLTFGIAVLK